MQQNRVLKEEERRQESCQTRSMIGNDKKSKEKMSELQTVSLIFLKISINESSSGVRNKSSTVTSKIFSLRPSQNMRAQRVVIS